MPCVLGVVFTSPLLVGVALLCDASASSPTALQDSAAAQKESSNENNVDRVGDPLPASTLARLGTVRLRHAGWVTGITFARDGKWIVSGGTDNLVRIWD